MNHIEKECVKEVYEEIAKDFDRTRVFPWKSVREFILETNPTDTIYEAGCGNGKNMLLKSGYMKGSDFCEKFVKICKEKDLNVELGDVCDIKEEEESFSHSICVAVIHHLSTEERRLKALNELCRIVKKGGEILITVWGYEANGELFSSSDASGDQYVEWKRRGDDKIFKRYYHFFTKEEITALCEKTGCKVISVKDECKNWIIRLLK